MCRCVHFAGFSTLLTECEMWKRMRVFVARPRLRLFRTRNSINRKCNPSWMGYGRRGTFTDPNKRRAMGKRSQRIWLWHLTNWEKSIDDVRQCVNCVRIVRRDCDVLANGKINQRIRYSCCVCPTATRCAIEYSIGIRTMEIEKRFCRFRHFRLRWEGVAFVRTHGQSRNVKKVQTTKVPIEMEMGGTRAADERNSLNRVPEEPSAKVISPKNFHGEMSTLNVVSVSWLHECERQRLDWRQKKKMEMLMNRGRSRGAGMRNVNNNILILNANRFCILWMLNDDSMEFSRKMLNTFESRIWIVCLEHLPRACPRRYTQRTFDFHILQFHYVRYSLDAGVWNVYLLFSAPNISKAMQAHVARGTWLALRFGIGHESGWECCKLNNSIAFYSLSIDAKQFTRLLSIRPGGDKVIARVHCARSTATNPKPKI